MLGDKTLDKLINFSMTNLLLINEINKDNFQAELFDGFIVEDVNFVKHFNFSGNEINDAFAQVNYFLLNNGYNTLNFDNWNDDVIEDELMSVYGNPYCNENNKTLVLVIYRLEIIKRLHNSE